VVPARGLTLERVAYRSASQEKRQSGAARGRRGRNQAKTGEQGT